MNHVAQQAFGLNPKRARRPHIDPTIHALIQLRRAISKVLMINHGASDVPANLRLTARANNLLSGSLVELAQDSKKLHWHHLFQNLQMASS
eukprot:5966035-Pyramimonas_sp.AAC.1